MRLDWSHWLYGLFAALIGGGAGAVITAASGAVVVPSAINLGAGFHHLMQLIYVSFVFHGLLSAAFYLQKSPLPAIEPEPTTPEKKG